MNESNGYLIKTVCTRLRAFFNVSIIVLIMLVFSACKAESALEIELQDFSSGTLTFRLKVDEEAASFLRDDAFTKQTFNDVLQTQKLEDAGFDVSVDENTNGADSEIVLRKNFNNEADLKNALSSLANDEVANVALKNSRSVVNEKTQIELNVDLSKLKSQYLDESLKTNVESAGYDWEDYTALVESGFKNTTLKITIKGDQKVEKSITPDSSSQTLNVSKQSFRTGFILSMGAGIACLIVGAVLLRRFCRRPKLLSKVEPETE